MDESHVGLKELTAAELSDDDSIKINDASAGRSGFTKFITWATLKSFLSGALTFLTQDAADLLYKAIDEPSGLADAAAVTAAFVASPSDAAALGGLFGSALYGDGSDGDVVVDSSTFNFPSLVGVSAWQANHVYAAGAVVKSTGANVRVFECLTPGTSCSTDTFPDGLPGANRYGNRARETSPQSIKRPAWIQLTKIIQGHLEGPIFADNFTVQAGFTLAVHGWPIYARSTATTEATSILSAKGVDAVGATPGAGVAGSLDQQALLGKGINGSAPNFGGTLGKTWGGGIGGPGGTGADYPDYSGANANHLNAGVTSDGSSAAMTFTRRMLPTMFSPYYYSQNSNDDVATIGSTGGGGASDAGAGKSGGASGSAGSAAAVFAKALVHNGLIDASGGNGGDGETGGEVGGGGGSSGGCVVLVYNAKTGTGTVDVSGGVGGQGKQGSTVSLAIIAVDQGAKIFTVAGEKVPYFAPASVFTVTGSTGNNGSYTVVSTDTGSGNTDVTVVEAIPDATADGNLICAGGHAANGSNGSPGDFVEFVNA